MTEENQKIIDHSLEYCTDLLEDTGEFYPFGAYIGIEGHVHPLEYEFDKKNMPTNGQVIDWLQHYCEEEMSANRMKAYGVIYEVSIQLEEGQKPKEAICIDIAGSSEENLPLFYIPYQFDKQGNVAFEEMFAVKRG